MGYIQPRRQTINRLWVCNGLHNGAKRNMRITLEIHLRDQTLRPSHAEAAKVNMCRPPKFGSSGDK